MTRWLLFNPLLSLGHHITTAALCRKQTCTETTTETCRVSGLHGGVSYTKNLSTSPPPLSSLMQSLFPLTRGETTRPVISLVCPSIALHPLLKGNAELRVAEWARGRGYMTVFMSMCATKCTCLKKVSVPLHVFENVCVSLPLTFCRLGGQ